MVSGSCSLVAVRRSLIVVAAFVVEPRFWGFSSCGTWAQQLRHVGSAVAARGLSSCSFWSLAHRLSSCGAWA